MSVLTYAVGLVLLLGVCSQYVPGYLDFTAVNLSWDVYRNTTAVGDSPLFVNDTADWTIIAKFQNTKATTKIYVNNRRQLIFVAHRGTSDTEDVFQDADIFPVSCSINGVGCGYVDQGFLTAFNQDYIAVTSTILPYTSNGYTVVFTGHSKGGAVATISALYHGIINDTKQATILYTFGSPHPGSSDFAATVMHYVPSTIRYVDKYQLFGNWIGEAITQLPPNFSPVGNQVGLMCNDTSILRSANCHKMMYYQYAVVNGLTVSSAVTIASNVLLQLFIAIAVIAFSKQ
jgi:hypothetical protein